MPRLIDAEALLKHRQHARDIAKYDGELYVVGVGYIMDAPTIDAAPVVRCEQCANLEMNCKYWPEMYDKYHCHELDKVVHTIGYCGHGRRAEEAK